MSVKLLILAAAFQVGPFYEQKDDYAALRPLWSREAETTDVVWPLWTQHRDWWRFCFFISNQRHPQDGNQFSVFPFWFSGTDPKKGDYAAFFPFYGRHPHIMAVYDLEFAMWPVWMRYRMPRARKDAKKDNEWLETNSVLFPFFSWRDDGSWGIWPFYGVSHNRESDHRYCLWPFVTWADYRGDRDTSGAGDSMMLWPFYGYIAREREKQALFLPPFFSWAETRSLYKKRLGDDTPGIRLRFPWPFVEYESVERRERLSIFPLYERIEDKGWSKGAPALRTTRFGWRLVELLPDETRVFPFWAQNGDGYLRVWPFYERTAEEEQISRTRVLSLFPIRWVSAVDRNWAKFWTFYESEKNPVDTRHSLFWGLIRWRTVND